MSSYSENVRSLAKMAAQHIIDDDCRRNCKHYRDGRSPFSCKHFYPHDNGDICCYGWRPHDESTTESTA